MHSLVVDIRGGGLVQSANRESARRDAVGLLLVADEMLDARNHVLLHRDNGLVQKYTSKERIVGEALPVAAAPNNSS